MQTGLIPGTRVERYTTDSPGGRNLQLLRSRGRGAASSPPLLLLHGSTLPGSIAYTLAFNRCSAMDALARSGRDVWQLDFRGYGGSWRPADDGRRPSQPVADTEQATDDLSVAAGFIESETGDADLDLFGWSWGATVAAVYAAREGRVGRLVLHAPQWLRDTPSPMVTPQSMSEPYRTVDPVAFVDRWQARVDADTRKLLRPWQETLEHTLAYHAPIVVPNGSARDIAAQWMAGRPAYDPADIQAPTLVIVGDADADTPPVLARTVYERLGTSRKAYAEVPLGTHFTLFEPARSALFDQVEAFLTECSLKSGAE